MGSTVNIIFFHGIAWLEYLVILVAFASADNNECVSADNDECVSADNNECVSADNNECVSADNNECVSADNNECVSVWQVTSVSSRSSMTIGLGRLSSISQED